MRVKIRFHPECGKPTKECSCPGDWTGTVVCSGCNVERDNNEGTLNGFSFCPHCVGMYLRQWTGATAGRG